MNTQQNNVIKNLNRQLNNFGTMGKEGDRLYLYEGNLTLDGRTLIAKMTDDGLLIGISRGKLKLDAINVLKLLDGIDLQNNNKTLTLNGSLWSGELTYLNQEDGTWKYRRE